MENGTDEGEVASRSLESVCRDRDQHQLSDLLGRHISESYEVVDTKPATHDGRQPEHGERLLRHVCAGGIHDRLLQRSRDRVRSHIGGGIPGQQPDPLPICSKPCQNMEWVAPTSRQHPLHRWSQPGSQRPLGEIHHALDGERLQVEDRGVWPDLLLESHHRAVYRAGAVRDHDEQRRLTDHGSQLLQHSKAGLIRPMEIVEHQQMRSSLQCTLDASQQPISDAFRSDRGPARKVVAQRPVQDCKRDLALEFIRLGRPNS
ncbi:MAG: hypothetical protein WAM30_13130 [Candidatus Dormiibacterota bacterium]